MSTDNEFIDVFRLIAEDPDDGVRLDQYLADQDLGLTRSKIKKLIDAGLATVSSSPARPSQKLRPGQEVILKVPPPTPLSVSPEDIPLDVRHEDDHVLVVNKPQGLVVHPAPGHPTGTLVNAVLFGRLTKGGDPLRPGIVHRLDKDTSGLMVVAKDERTHAGLAVQFHEHSVERCYTVLVAGNPPEKGEWKTLHGRKPRDRRLFSSKVEKGKQAVSLFDTVERFKGAARLAVTLKTGRTHQVRVHCADHGFPVLGDPWYGPKHMSPKLATIHNELPGQALHAAVLGFDHPVTGKRERFEADPPEAFLEALEKLRGLS